MLATEFSRDLGEKKEGKIMGAIRREGPSDHCQCDVTSYIGDFQNGGQISCSLRCKGCQFSECLDSSFAFFNKAELLKNNMVIFAIRFSRKKFQKHHMRQRKVSRSVYKLAQFV